MQYCMLCNSETYLILIKYEFLSPSIYNIKTCRTALPVLEYRKFLQTEILKLTQNKAISKL